MTINTNPTEKGKSISIYDHFYVTKRIREKKPKNMDLELWLLIVEAEEKGLIEITFDSDSKGKKYAIKKEIGNLLLSE